MTTLVNTSNPFVQAEILVENSVMTNRNRFALWVAMGMLKDEIEMDLENFVPYGQSLTFADFPVCAKGQGQDWWRAVAQSAQRLWEALRTGEDVVHLQNVAEEVIMWIVAEKRVYEVMDYLDEDEDYLALPASNDDIGVGLVRVDDLYEEIAEDADVESLWDKKMSPMLDPTYYAPANWWTSFR